MNLRRIIMVLSIAALTCTGVEAQGILGRLANRAKQAAENAVGNKIENAINDVIENGLPTDDGDDDEGYGDDSDEAPASQAPERRASSRSSSASSSSSSSSAASASKTSREISSQYAKSDFVPGDEVIFEDDFQGEQLGEFPSKWDILKGVVEVVKYDGRMTFDFQDEGTVVTPLMKGNDYLTDEFTIETDYFSGDDSELGDDKYAHSEYRLRFLDADGEEVCALVWLSAPEREVQCYYTSASGNGVTSEGKIDKYLVDNDWNHLSVSFNKRAFKAYINGSRVINIPSMKAPTHITIEARTVMANGADYLSNFRICKGAVPLYNRLTTDGKIITYAITFETGKADLKPESMTEIARITKLMKDDSNLKFEVQGHCDNTGSAAVNDPLSQKRAEAIVAALVGEGISKDRLTAVGKGSNEPIADNATDEGRAKNRRVEFIKK